MCGIHLGLSIQGFLEPSANLKNRIQSRGPDSLQQVQSKISIGSLESEHVATAYATFTSSVLSLRGDRVWSQPLQNDQGSFFCWNGEAWKLGNEVLIGYDGDKVFETLLHGFQSQPGCSETHSAADDQFHHPVEAYGEDLLCRLSQISGPYAFVLYDARHKRLLFARDPLGRRSLLYRHEANGNIHLSSISDNQLNGDWNEAEAGMLYSVQSRTGKESLQILPIGACTGNKVKGLGPARIMEDGEDTTGPSRHELHGISVFPELNKTIPSANFRPPHAPPTSLLAIQRLITSSLQLRSPNTQHLLSNSKPETPKIGILFSGGLDCTLLARVLHDVSAPEDTIDLLNVAFENPRKVASYSNATLTTNNLEKEAPYERCPDRRTARRSLAELRSVCSDRKWNFVKINIPYAEYQRHRSTIVSLMAPQNTEMDLSISSALYFAARGIGVLESEDLGSEYEYTSPVRVLLSGLGADELFAGYSRHALAFARGGYKSLSEELELDFRRLGSRNLGRDDRVISHWARECRYPFLDEDLVRWALQCPVWHKCGFQRIDNRSTAKNENGDGLDPTKRILRDLAIQLGLKEVAKEKKRAIQFGACTAKMESGKTKGTNVLA